MSIHTSFYKFSTGSDTVGDGNGQSSVAYLVTSDAGDVLMALSSDHRFHVTQMHVTLESLSDSVRFALCTADSNSSDAGITRQSQFYEIGTGAAVGANMSQTVNFNPPIKITYSSTASGNGYLGMYIHANDSDANVGIAYSGFTTPA